MTQKTTIKVCTGPRCTQNLSHYTLERAKNECAFLQKTENIHIEECGCRGNCEKGPTVLIEKNEIIDQKNFMNPTEIAKTIRRL
jgi:NADH:ubiquinone oxidoreductase subunit E